MQKRDEFRTFWTSLQPLYGKLKKRSAAAVVHERWASDDMFDLRPMSEACGFIPGKWLNTPPRNPFYKYKYGLDAQRQPALATMQMKDPYDRTWRETLYSHESGTIVAATFDHCELRKKNFEHKMRPTVVERLTLKDGKPSVYEHLTELGGETYLRLEYFYQDGRIARVVSADDSEGELEIGHWRVTHDSDGKVAGITHEKGGKVHSIRWPYRRRTKPLNLKQLTRQLENTLFTLIVEAIARAKIREPVYSLVLGYSSEAPIALPPFVGLGTERERRDWQAKLQADDLDAVLWNPEEYAHRDGENEALAIGNPEFESACHYFVQLLGRRDALADSVKILEAVAKSLAKHKWGNALKRTKDFTVKACDVENPGAGASTPKRRKR